MTDEQAPADSGIDVSISVPMINEVTFEALRDMKTSSGEPLFTPSESDADERYEALTLLQGLVDADGEPMLASHRPGEDMTAATMMGYKIETEALVELADVLSSKGYDGYSAQCKSRRCLLDGVQQAILDDAYEIDPLKRDDFVVTAHSIRRGMGKAVSSLMLERDEVGKRLDRIPVWVRKLFRAE